VPLLLIDMAFFSLQHIKRSWRPPGGRWVVEIRHRELGSRGPWREVGHGDLLQGNEG
jgi:hypothetical protein